MSDRDGDEKNTKATNAYSPDADEAELSYLFSEGMSDKEKLGALSGAWWQAMNSGYCDAMANRLASGIEDAQTRLWERNCSNVRAIDRLWNFLNDKIGE